YSRRDQDVENPTFIVDGVTRFAELRAGGEVAITIDIESGSDLSPAVMDDVRRALDGHVGSAPLELKWQDERGSAVRFRSRTLTIAATPLALSDLRALLGTERVRLIRA